MKKKILYLSQVYPYPADGGGKIKTYRTLQALAKKYIVSAVFISEYQPTPAEITHLKKLGVAEVTVFFNAQILASVKADLLHLTYNFLQLRPHYVFQYTHVEAATYIIKKIAQYKPDIIHIDHINIAQYLPKQKKEIWLLEHHNVEFYLLWTRFIHSSKLSRKLYLAIESCLTYLFELKVIRKFDHIFTISEQDRTRVIKNFLISPDSVSTQPLIYPIATQKKQEARRPYVLFIGNICWPPNEDAIEWFLTTMWPKILQKIPTAEIHIVGKRNFPWEKNNQTILQQKNVYLEGFQKNISQFLRQAHVFILPFRMGGGVRIKSLTALAHGVPLVSTALGVEGVKVVEKKEFLLATEKTFPQKINTLLRNKSMRNQMSKQQLQYMKRMHATKMNQQFLKLYEQVTSKV